MSKTLDSTIDGTPAMAAENESAASAQMNANGVALRQSISGEPRGPVCGMGVCFECRATIDGVGQQRTCQLPNQSTIPPQTQTVESRLLPNAPSHGRTARSFDVVIVGAGPAGIAAACIAAEAGRSVAIVDDNPHIGGQIWRRDARKPATGAAAQWHARLRKLPVEWLPRTTILGTLAPDTLLAESADGSVQLSWRHLILACGARERFVPFPGWTLPGVFGAGGLQAFVKAGFRVAHRKIVIAGSGPLLLPVAAHLRAHGADIRLIAEQTPRIRLLRFAASLGWHQPSKILEALGLGWKTRGIPYRPDCWPIRADGSDRVTSVTLTDGARTWTEPCDMLACGFGLVANRELALLLGCTTDRFVSVDAQQRTSIANVYAVGELTGIGGVDKALLEGQIAGWMSAEKADRAQSLVQPRDRLARFVSVLDESFALREELKRLADANTILCRCEDVRFGILQKYTTWRDAKLQTRCGMGPCQGRTCGPIVEHLFGWGNDSIRPPIFPARLGTLAG